MRGTTYRMSSPCPCDDCEYQAPCKEHGKSCRVSRYWEQEGEPLIQKGTAVERVPDRDI